MIPFAGPSYNLALQPGRHASAQRSVNLFPVRMEAGTKEQWILQQVPGLILKSTVVGPCRGVKVARGKLYTLHGDKVQLISAIGTATELGSLATASNEVGMAWGLNQLLIVDGPNGYVVTLATDTVAQITDPDFPGADACGYLDGFFTLTYSINQQAYVTAIDDATNIDALYFVSAESSPDNIVTHIIAHREEVFLGENGIERWFNSGGSDYPFSRDAAATAEVGCVAPNSVSLADNGIFWIGGDANGGGIVFRDVNRQPVRISSIAVEQALQASTDISEAVSYTYQANGLTFYCINAPGVDSTWCYEVSSGQWHERADVDEFGEFIQLRVTHTAYCYGKHWAFDADGNIYEMSDTVNTFAGDTMRRTRISPNDVTPMRDWKYYAEFALDCTTGECEQGITPSVELSYSDDGGFTWGDPMIESLGEVGEYFARVVWHRLGRARDRVWRIDCTSDAPFSVISGNSR